MKTAITLLLTWSSACFTCQAQKTKEVSRLEVNQETAASYAEMLSNLADSLSSVHDNIRYWRMEDGFTGIKVNTADTLFLMLFEEKRVRDATRFFIAFKAVKKPLSQYPAEHSVVFEYTEGNTHGTFTWNVSNSADTAYRNSPIPMIERFQRGMEMAASVAKKKNSEEAP